MQMHNLKRIHPHKRGVPVGRGGKRGKTSGRGGKGQTARAGHKIYPQLRDVIKRIPKLRGRGKHSLKSFSPTPVPVSLSALEARFGDGSDVTPHSLLQKGILSLRSGRVPPIKILGGSAVTKRFRVSGCFISRPAREAIEKAGGSVA